MPQCLYDDRFLLLDSPALQVYKAEDVSGEVIVELDVTWAGQQNVQLVIKPFPKFHLGVGVGVGKIISNFLAMRVGVGNLFFSGRVRLSLKPLMGRLPVVGAVRVSFVEQPHFNYALTVYGGDISFLPGQHACLVIFFLLGQHACLAISFLPGQHACLNMLHPLYTLSSVSFTRALFWVEQFEGLSLFVYLLQCLMQLGDTPNAACVHVAIACNAVQVI